MDVGTSMKVYPLQWKHGSGGDSTRNVTMSYIQSTLGGVIDSEGLIY